MRASESLALTCFAVLTLLAWLRPLPAARRWQITAIGVATSAGILWLARDGHDVARDWAPAALILIGYYASGRFFVRPSPALERWLIGWDRRLLGDPVARFSAWPAPVLAFLDIAYTACFLLVPGGFAALAATGRSALADSYWTLVMSAEFAAFVPLAFFQTRPPWAIEPRRRLPDRAAHRLASRLIERFTIHANTFPSGHVAGALAVAFALLGPMPWIGAMCLLLAIAIAVACVVGRYHYVVDVIAGALVACLGWAIVGAPPC